MKIVRKLSDTGDYVFGFNQNNFITGVDAVAQMIKTKLLLLRGEWWQDILDGTPVVQQILNVYNIDTASIAAESICSARVMEVEGVLNIEDIQVENNRETRMVTVRMKVNTVYGQLEQVVEI